jgi:L-threonylcarbamoyladenylate synthase
LAAPSANKFGRTSPTSFSHVNEEFAGVVPVLDGGACEVGIESTVLLIKQLSEQEEIQFSILREGLITESEMKKILEKNKIRFNFIKAISKKESPGHMKHHYMPAVPLILCDKKPESVEWLKKEIRLRILELPKIIEGVEIVKPKNINTIKELKLSSKPNLAARELYSQLRQLAAGSDIIYYVFPADFNSEQWSALRDRITKAASLYLIIA